MADIVVLTGITGFLGGHLAKELLNAGYHVRGSLRNPARADAVRKALWDAGEDISRLEFVTLNLTSDAGWDSAMAGARFLMHSASPFVTTMPKDKGELIRPAVDGTARALGAALRAGVERVVLTSSSVAITAGRGPGKARLGAEDWADPDSGRLNAYAESKTRAERKAWEMVQGQEHRLAVINPGFITGPLLDDDPGTSGAVIQRFLRGNIPVAPNFWLNGVDVRDLARLHVAALTDAEAAGRRIPSAFGKADLHAIGQMIARAYPDYARQVPRLRAPDWFIRLYALFDGDMRANVGELGQAVDIDASTARRLLARAPVQMETSVADMAGSLIARGLA